MGRDLFLRILFCGLPFVAQGQTVVWQMPPSDYNEIVRLSSNLLMVSRNGKIGLANTDGSMVAPMVNENITDYYEHKALLLSNDGHGERITGCLTDDGKYYGYAKKYYALNGQKFFSDGVLSVADENGNLGYIDVSGNQIVGFEGKYSRIKPYSEGFAAVMKGKKYVLIDKAGDEVKFTYGGTGVGAAVGGCTNVYNGICYVYDEYGGNDRSFFTYDTKGNGKLKKTSRVKNTTMDYLFCYQSVSGRTKDVPYEPRKPYAGAKGIAPTLSNGFYGYQTESTTILPCQLSKAEQFEDGEAIVEVNGAKGILKYIDGESFSVLAGKVRQAFYAGDNVKLSFTLNVPSVWKDKPISVIVKNGNGIDQALSNNGNNYSFTIKPSGSAQLDYVVTVFGDNLKLYDGMLSYTMTKKERCLVCGKDKDQCEYKGVHPSAQGSGSEKAKTEKICETCGKKISECKYQGVH